MIRPPTCPGNRNRYTVSYRPRCRNDSSQRCSLKQLGELVLFFRREIEDIQQNTLK